MSEIRTTNNRVETTLVTPDPTKPLEQDKSLGELLSRLTTDFGDLVSTQMELAKVEIKEDVQRAGKGAGMLTGAGVTAYLALILLSMALAWLLDDVMPRSLAFAIVGVVWAIVAAVLYGRGRTELHAIEGAPKTKQTIQEDVEWARQQKS